MERKKNSPDDDSEFIERDDQNQPVGARKFWLGIWDLFKTIVLIVVLTYAIRLFIIQPFIVEGQSMEPAFQNADYLITEKISFRFRQIERGEIVIFHPPENPEINYIKRVVGLPGDTISIKDGEIFINSKQLLEPYLSSNKETLTQSSGYSVTLADNQYFLLGDNRNHSRDSREIGPIPQTNIVSRVWFRLLPITSVRAFAAVNYAN